MILYALPQIEDNIKRKIIELKLVIPVPLNVSICRQNQIFWGYKVRFSLHVEIGCLLTLYRF